MLYTIFLLWAAKISFRASRYTETMTATIISFSRLTVASTTADTPETTPVTWGSTSERSQAMVLLADSRFGSRSELSHWFRA